MRWKETPHSTPANTTEGYRMVEEHLMKYFSSDMASAFDTYGDIWWCVWKG